MKPLGHKSYGSIPHFPGSRMGPGDHKCSSGQLTIATVKARDKHDVIIVQEKVDGCFSWRTEIQTDKGRIPIGKIVNQKLRVLIPSYNENLKVVEYKPILEYHRQDRNAPWYRVIVYAKSRGKAVRQVICTSTHKFITPNGEKRADELVPGNPVYIYSEEFSSEIKQMILGILLGDGSLNRNNGSAKKEYKNGGGRGNWGFKFSNGEEQLAFFRFKCKLFGDLVKEGKPQFGGYEGSGLVHNASSLITPIITELLEKFCVVKDKKIVTKQWADALTPLSLAFWYMDDGSCDFNENQRPRLVLHTEGFSLKEVTYLKKSLKVKYGLDSTISNSKGWYLNLSADSTQLFFDLVYPFITISMKYKLPKKYQSRVCVLDNLTFYDKKFGVFETTVKGVEKNGIKVYEGENDQYDITVADNHNYFAGDILVHNSNCGVAKINNTIVPLTRAGYRAETSPFEQHHYFAKWVLQPERWGRFNALLLEGERLCGEWLMQAHGTIYKLPHEPFVAFDLMRGMVRTPWPDFRARVEPCGFTVPNTIHEGGPLSIEEAMERLKVSGHGAQGPVEGAVWRVERYDLVDKSIGSERRRIVDYLAKYVRPDKQDGIYLPEVSGNPSIWNWFPE